METKLFATNYAILITVKNTLAPGTLSRAANFIIPVITDSVIFNILVPQVDESIAQANPHSV